MEAPNRPPIRRTLTPAVLLAAAFLVGCAGVSIAFVAAQGEDSLSVRFRVEDVASSRTPGTSFGAGKVFLQMRGTYEVRGTVAGRAIAFSQRGAAETFAETP